MVIDVLDPDKFVKLNFLEEVTSSLFFDDSGVPDPRGLFSYNIFGDPGSNERRNRFAYIDLAAHYLHPHAYKLVMSLDRKIGSCIEGKDFFILNKQSRKLEKVADDVPGASTGLDFLYEVWDKLEFKESASDRRANRINLLKFMKKDEIFMTKQLVIPAFYRDINFESKRGGGGASTVDINSLYKKLITTSQTLKHMGESSYTFSLTKAIMQKTIMDIYEYFKGLIQLKNGFMTKAVLGKNTDFSVRTLITAPSFSANKWQDLPADFEHAAVPLTQCITLFIPFIQAYIKSWVEAIIMDRKNIPVYDMEKKEIVRLDLHKDWAADFESDKIATKANLFYTTPESRFLPVNIRFADNSYKPFAFIQGDKDIVLGESGELNAEALKGIRYFTWTDLFYIAAKEVTKDKHVLTVRYPVTGHHSEYFAAVNVRSTIETTEMLIGDTYYKTYPKVDLSLKKEQIESRFIDSLEIFSPYIGPLGADHDGDQVTVKGLYTYEANKWAKEYIKSAQNILGTDGNSVRKPGDAAKHSMWNLIRDPDKNSKKLDPVQTNEVLSIKDSDITKEMMISLFGRTDKLPAKFNPNDILILKAGDPIPWKISTVIETTVGRYIYNIFLNSGCFGQKFEYFNNASSGKFDTSLDEAIVEETVTMDEISKYQTKRAWLEYTNIELLVPGSSYEIMTPNDKVMSLKKKLIEQYKKELNSPESTIRVNAATAIEKQLLDYAAEVFKDDPSYRLYDKNAGGKPSWGNNYKNMCVMVGATADNTNQGEFGVSTSNFVEGIDVEDYARHADTNITGTYARAVDTQVGGTQTKEFNAALQGEILDENRDSDCKTQRFQELVLTDALADIYKYKWIIEKGQHILLTPKNVKSYIGKKIMVRSAMFCQSEHYCSKCAGKLYGRLNIKNAGLTCSQIGTTFTNLAMKAFHDASMKTIDINWQSYFSDF